MDRGTTTSGSFTDSTLNTDVASDKLDDASRTAHQKTDQMASKASEQVDRMSGNAHRAIDAASEWASGIPDQAKQMQTRFTESANEQIRAHPIATVAGALVVGYVLARLTRSDGYRGDYS